MEPAIGPILVTGSSGGIGRATCERLVRSGHVVYASARDIRATESLQALGCHGIALDVTDESSMQDAVAVIEQAHSRIGVLINNAGYGVYGPIEQLGVEQLRQEFETNVFGLTRLTQLVLPTMRRHGSGRIINISSVAGKATFPGGAYYHASKFALEALSDALRLEVAPFGIRVVVIEPGPVATEWAARAASSLPLDESGDEGDPYESFKNAVAAMLLDRSTPARRRIEVSPERVARVIDHAMSATHPHSRYVVGLSSRAMLAIRKVLPDAAYDALMRNRFRIS